MFEAKLKFNNYSERAEKGITNRNSYKGGKLVGEYNRVIQFY